MPVKLISSILRIFLLFFTLLALWTGSACAIDPSPFTDPGETYGVVGNYNQLVLNRAIVDKERGCNLITWDKGSPEMFRVLHYFDRPQDELFMNHLTDMADQLDRVWKVYAWRRKGDRGRPTLRDTPLRPVMLSDEYKFVRQHTAERLIAAGYWKQIPKKIKTRNGKRGQLIEVEVPFAELYYYFATSCGTFLFKAFRPLCEQGEKTRNRNAAQGYAVTDRIEVREHDISLPRPLTNDDIVVHPITTWAQGRSFEERCTYGNRFHTTLYYPVAKYSPVVPAWVIGEHLYLDELQKYWDQTVKTLEGVQLAVDFLPFASAIRTLIQAIPPPDLNPLDGGKTWEHRPLTTWADWTGLAADAALDAVPYVGGVQDLRRGSNTLFAMGTVATVAASLAASQGHNAKLELQDYIRLVASVIVSSAVIRKQAVDPSAIADDLKKAKLTKYLKGELGSGSGRDPSSRLKSLVEDLKQLGRFDEELHKASKSFVASNKAEIIEGLGLKLLPQPFRRQAIKLFDNQYDLFEVFGRSLALNDLKHANRNLKKALNYLKRNAGKTIDGAKVQVGELSSSRFHDHCEMYWKEALENTSNIEQAKKYFREKMSDYSDKFITGFDGGRGQELLIYHPKGFTSESGEVVKKGTIKYIEDIKLASHVDGQKLDWSKEYHKIGLETLERSRLHAGGEEMLHAMDHLHKIEDGVEVATGIRPFLGFSRKPARGAPQAYACQDPRTTQFRQWVKTQTDEEIFKVVTDNGFRKNSADQCRNIVLNEPEEVDIFFRYRSLDVAETETFRKSYMSRVLADHFLKEIVK